MAQIKLALPAGKANPAPPVGPALGSKVRAVSTKAVAGGALCAHAYTRHRTAFWRLGALPAPDTFTGRVQGVNIMAFCKEYNAKTADKAGMIIPVAITVYEVRAALMSLESEGTLLHATGLSPAPLY